MEDILRQTQNTIIHYTISLSYIHFTTVYYNKNFDPLIY